MMPQALVGLCSMSTAAVSLPFRNLGWMPLNVGQFLRKTADLDPEESTKYLQHLVDEWIAKRLRCHYRASKAARVRWRLLPLSTSMADAQANAASIGKLVEKTLSGALKWIGNSQIRSEKARRAAQARWARNGHSASIAQAPVRDGVFTPSHTPGRVILDSRDLAPSFPPPLPPNAAAPSTESPRIDLGAARQYPKDRNPYEQPSTGVAGTLHRFIERLKNRPDPQNADPRSDLFRAEVLKFWAAQNPDNPECPWIRKDEKALRALLEGSPKLEFERFQSWLRNRARSEVNPSDLPRRWLADLAEFADGPLNQFRKPLRSRREEQFMYHPPK